MFKVVSVPSCFAEYVENVLAAGTTDQANGVMDAKLLNIDEAACVKVISNLSPSGNVYTELAPV